jgi:hypothetical protein
MRPGIKAHSFELRRCSNPNCGPHIIAFNKDNMEVCDIVIPPSGAASFVQALQDLLYLQAVERDDHKA